MVAHRCVTVVVGAGPAGLLFCLVAAIRGGETGSEFILVDKRATYERTHRLRMDRAPYLAVKEKLAHPLYDELIDFLERDNFRPAANRLEAKLEDLVGRVGIHKQSLAIGDGPGETDLVQLREQLYAAGTLQTSGSLIVIGADSVKSATRSMLGAPGNTVERIHQMVARLRIDGDDLPSSLDPIRQFKVAKLLGSAIDYRSNQNGFAEVDLFLSPEEHAMVEHLNARPATPVALTSDLLDGLGTPLFASVAEHMRSDLGTGSNQVSIHSTFRLEHRYQQQVAVLRHETDGAATAIFLVGDAAVSLPFFRGMACLMACADELALIHTEVTKNGAAPDELAAGVQRYNDVVTAIRTREVATVESRARAVRVAREVVRISSMAPFPIQTWLLSIRPRTTVHPRQRFTVPLLATVILVALAATLAVLSPRIGFAGLLSVPLQTAAGAIYRSDLASPRRPNPLIAGVCRLQVAALLLAGLWIALLNPFDSGWWIRAGAAIGWWVLGLLFIAGMYLYEEFTS